MKHTPLPLTMKLTLAAMALAPLAALHAAVKPNPLFSDNAVLQQGIAVPVWGTAGEGEKVTVTFAGQTAAMVAKAGKWKVTLAALKASETPQTMTISGENKVEIKNVLVGEVWVCSGQSNMQFTLGKAANAATEIPTANYPKLRMFTVERKPAIQPQAEANGSWQECSPQTVSSFSAVGYFFGRDLLKARGGAVGMIHTSWGGTPAQSWTSLSGLEKESELAGYVQAIGKVVADYPQAVAKAPQAAAAYSVAVKQWQAEIGKEFNPKLAQWNKDVKLALAASKPLPRKPLPTRPMPVKPLPPEGPAAGGSATPTLLYNGMIAPLIPYAIKGVIWYQGESNAPKSQEYRTLFPRMIADWREKWSQGEFPFLFVQIAPYQGLPPEIREAQLVSWKKTPNTAMAVITDVGDASDIHPTKKEPVGARLALAARAIAYGEKLEYSGPLYQAVKIDGNKAIISFTHLGGGLVAKDGALKGFTIAGADKNFVPATAVIRRDQIVVSSDQVAAPVAVRYGWANVPDVNLFNQNGLPATPFRTDDRP